MANEPTPHEEEMSEINKEWNDVREMVRGELKAHYGETPSHANTTNFLMNSLITTTLSINKIEPILNEFQTRLEKLEKGSKSFIIRPT